MKCRICGNQKNNQTFKVKEMMFGFNDFFDYFECSECGCLQIDEIPEDISKYYPSDYYSFEDLKSSILSLNNLERYLTSQRDKYALTGKGVMGYFINKIRPSYYIDIIVRAKINLNSRILDVGCGSGYFLRSLGDVGFKYLYGIDPNIEKDIEYANGVKILKKSIHEIDDKFDLIIFNHSFEHIHNPHDTLKSVSKLLSESGKCIIRIPTVSSYAWKKYNVNWVQLDAPRHIYLYSIKSIKLICMEAGLSLIDFYYDSTELQFWGSEQYLREIPLNSSNSYKINTKKSIFTKSDIKLFKMKAKELNRNESGDQVCLYFSKM
jgi:2-polyprenyl-3-methyl-5-hydroxy-6-metoxy-1,4-benzoquinol methylase